MTLRHLECALAVANAGSINQAAKKLLVSQPYLSGIIISLEKELGYSIFIRGSHGLNFTPQGAAFIRHAENIMSEIAAMQSIGKEFEPPLKVATYYSRFVTDAFLRFHGQSEGSYDDRCREMGNMEVIDAVSGRDFSIGIIYHAKTKFDKFSTLAQMNNLVYHSLFENMGTYLIMAGHHPLAKKDTITLDDLGSSAVVFYDDASTVLYMVEHLKLGQISKYYAVSDRGAFMDALLSGDYLSVINTPNPGYENLFVLKDLTNCLPEDADSEVSSAYLIRRDHKLTRKEQDFLDYLAQKLAK